MKTVNRKIAYGLFLIALIFVISCSDKNYKVLSIFFDGVPNPESVDTSSGGNKTTLSDTIPKINNTVQNKTSGYLHPPYEERSCDACHDQKAAGMFTAPQPDLCYICHDDFAAKYKFLHGPVAGGFCTECHNPHSSEIEKLLRRKGQDLCLICHKASDVFKNEVHADIGETSCYDCHNPHGGSDPYLF